MARASNEESGSQKMLALAGKKGVTADHVKEALSLGAASDYEVQWWWWRGQPGPDTFYGQILVDVERLGEMVQKLARSQYNIEINTVGGKSSKVSVGISNVPTAARR